MTGKKELAISIWDELNERSLIKIVDVRFLAHMQRFQKEKPEWVDLDELELKDALRQYSRPPTKIWNRMRLQFWNEYEYAQAMQTEMNIEKVYLGVCSIDAWRNLCKRNEFVAWILCPPSNWNTLLQEAVVYWIEEMRSILEEPNKDPSTGKLDHKLVNLKLKIGALLDMRLHGGFTQRVEQLQRNVNINLGPSSQIAHDEVQSMTIEQIQKKLKELEATDRQYSEDRKVFRSGAKLTTIDVSPARKDDE